MSMNRRNLLKGLFALPVAAAVAAPLAITKLAEHGFFKEPVEPMNLDIPVRMVVDDCAPKQLGTLTIQVHVDASSVEANCERLKKTIAKVLRDQQNRARLFR